MLGDHLSFSCFSISKTFSTASRTMRSLSVAWVAEPELFRNPKIDREGSRTLARTVSSIISIGMRKDLIDNDKILISKDQGFDHQLTLAGIKIGHRPFFGPGVDQVQGL